MRGSWKRDEEGFLKEVILNDVERRQEFTNLVK